MQNVHDFDDYLPRPWQRLYALRLSIRRTLLSPLVVEMYYVTMSSDVSSFVDLYRREVTGAYLPIPGSILPLAIHYPSLDRAQVVEIYNTPPGAFGYDTGHSFTVHAVLRQKRSIGIKEYALLTSRYGWSVLNRKLH